MLIPYYFKVRQKNQDILVTITKTYHFDRQIKDLWNLKKELIKKLDKDLNKKSRRDQDITASTNTSRKDQIIRTNINPN